MYRESLPPAAGQIARRTDLPHISLVTAIILFGLTTWLASAQEPGPSSDEFPITETTYLSQERPDLIVDPVTGRALVIWQGNLEGTGDGRDIGRRRVESTGLPVGGEESVNTATEGIQQRPSIARLDSGTSLVVWQSEVGLQNVDVLSRIHDSFGNPLASEMRVNTFTTSHQAIPDVAGTLDGGFVVVWQSTGQVAYDTTIHGQRVDSLGELLGDEFQVNTETTGQQYRPAVRASPIGGFVVVWESTGLEAGSVGIRAQRFSSGGSKLGGEFAVNTFTTLNQSAPRLDFSPSGDFVVVWQSNGGEDGSGYSVRGQLFNSMGVRISTEFQVTEFTVSAQKEPDVVTTDPSHFVVAWSGAQQHEDEVGIQGRRWGWDGSPVGGDFRINSLTLRSQIRPKIAPSGGGSFFVTWQSQDIDPLVGAEIRARTFVAEEASEIFADGFESGSTVEWSG